MTSSYGLLLVRHAVAAERGDAWPDDTKRPLTQKGILRMRRVVRGLAAADVDVALVLTSPLVRAKHTADLLASGLRNVPPVVLAPVLAPGAAPTAVAEELGRHQKARGIALVGHEPGLGELAAWLLGARAPLVFKKGGMAYIEVSSLPPTRPGTLHWFATPRMLRALGKT